MTTIYLMRHGRTQSNIDKIYAGWSDEPLTSSGAKEIHRIAVRLETLQIEKIFTSPIRRAVHTAEIINTELQTEIEIVPDLIELKMGPWEGLAEEEVASRYPDEWRTWNTFPSRLKLEGRETLDDLKKRALSALSFIADKSNLNRVIAVTHVALIRVLFIHYGTLSMDAYRTIDVPNGSVFEIKPEDSSKKMKRLS